MNSKKFKVTSDTTPIIALASINKLELLPILFKEITIAESVVKELHAGGRIKIPPPETIGWIKIKEDITDIKKRLLLELDEGEKQTILFGIESQNKNCEHLLLIDERKGRKTALSLGLNVKGTLGILADAKRRKLIDDFKSYAYALLENNLYYDLRLINAISQEVDK